MPARLPRNLIRTESKKPNRLCLVQSFFDFCSHGSLSEALHSLRLLAQKGLRLDARALAFLIQKCAALESLPHAKWIHLFLKLTGLKHPTTFLSNQILHMYVKCGSFNEARNLFEKMRVKNVFSWNAMLAGYTKFGMMSDSMSFFDRMPERDVVSWNTMIVGLAQNGMCIEALNFYTHLRRLSIGFNLFTFAGVLIACVKMEGLRLSQQVHGQVLVSGFLSNMVLASSIIDAYAKCGWIYGAHNVFDEMGVRDVMSWTTLVSGYSKLGDLGYALRLFESMPEKNAVSWTSIIAGYAEHGMGPTALELFGKMVKEGIRPDQFTFSSSLCACSSITSLKHGKQIHAHLMRIGFNPNSIVVSTLVDMYSKCGDLDSCRRVFSCIAKKRRDIVLWNTMISALAQHGCGQEAVRVFEEVLRLGMKPDEITFLVILTACSHSGLVNVGIQIFESMRPSGIVPNQEHMTCLVDLLGRAGQFDEVMYWLDKMPSEPDSRVWNALLGACRVHGNIALGKKAAQRLLELDPQSPVAYVSLSDIYVKAGQWELVEKMRQLMNEKQVRKDSAISWIEVGSKMNSFSVEDRLIPLKEEIHTVLELLAGQMEDEVNAT